jgi:uncharacterized protein involved in exopolysaccharide biosynthesis
VSAIFNDRRSADVPFAWVIATLLRRSKTILVVGAIGFALSLAVALIRPPTYAASFSFLPQSTQDQARSGLASLAGQFGIPIGSLSGASQPPQLYADVLESREVLGALASDSFQVTLASGKRGPLAAFLRIDDSDATIRSERTFQRLRSRVVSTGVAARTTGVVNATVRTASPRVSFEIAQRLIDGLNQFNRVTRQSQAREERRFIEGRLDEAKGALRSAEDALQAFLQRNRQFVSAQLKFEQDRLERTVTLQQQMVNNLAQQYEDARIREVRDTPVITVIERPMLPALPEPRRRLTIIVLGTAIAFGLGMMIALIREGWKRQHALEGEASYQELAEEWGRVRGRIPT